MSSIEELRCSLGLATGATWICLVSDDVLSSARRSTYRNFDPGGKCQERQIERWTVLLPRWGCNRLGKRNNRHPAFKHKMTRALISLHSSEQPVKVDSRLTTLDAQPQSCLDGLQGPFNAARLGDEIESLCRKGRLEEAVGILFRMDTVPSVSMYKSLLDACTKRRALAEAKRVYAHLAKCGLESNRFLADCVVCTLVKCGGLKDALHVFQGLPNRTAFSWTALISGYTSVGQGKEAIRMYDCMRDEGLEPSKYTFVSLLKACSSISDLEVGRRIHAEALIYRCDSDLFVGTSLVDMYAKCGSIEDAQRAFDGLSQRDVVSWNAMLAGYAVHGQAEKALQLYKEMAEEGVSPNQRTFVSALYACGMLSEKGENFQTDERSLKETALEKGRAIHADAWGKGHMSDIFIGNTLVSMYGKCGSIMDAQNVFDGLTERDLVSWNAMLAAYTQQGQAQEALQLYEEMLEEGLIADDRTFVNALQACGMLAEKEEDNIVDGQATKVICLEKGKALHADAWRMGYSSDSFLGNTLVSMYGKCRSIMDAQNVFDRLPERDVVSWTAVLTAYATEGQAETALQVYANMLEEGVHPNERTFVSVIQACGMLAGNEEDFTNWNLSKVKALEKGKVVHMEARRRGYGSYVFLGSSLVSMYGKCGSIVDAQKVFKKQCDRDVVSWNSMLVAYTQQGQAEKALEVFGQMVEGGVSPDVRTLVSSLHACAISAELEEDFVMDGVLTKLKSVQRGKAIHADASRRGHKSNIFICNTLISMYGKCGSIMDAQIAFDELFERDVVSWTAMLAAYAQQGQGEKALQLYWRMQEEGVSPNEVTLVSTLQACSHTGVLEACIEIHQEVVSNGGSLSPLLASALIHAYGRCASMSAAQTVFDALPQADVVSWTALIAGYAREGNWDISLQCYEKMQQAGVKPNEVTYLSILCACSHAGLVDQGVEYFESMSKKHSITPGIEHFSSIVDLLGRAGHFTLVEDLLATMPMQPDLPTWLCLLGACRKHGKVLLGRRAFDRAVSLQVNHPAAYVLMSNIYAHAGLWDDANAVNELRQKAGAWKKTGQSWIGHEQEIHTFVAGDKTHPQQDHLYGLILNLGLELDKEWSQVSNSKVHGVPH